MRNEHLAVFVSIVDTASISGAARRSHLPQSSVSSILNSLERELGKTLILRRRGQHTALRATHEGQIFYEYAQNVLRQYEQMCIQMRTPDERSPRPEIRLIVGQTLSVGIIPMILKELGKKAPEVRVQIEIQPSGNLEMIRQNMIDYVGDFTLCITPIEDDVFVSEAVMRDPLVLLCNRSLNLGQTITMEELKRLPLVLREQGAATMAFLRQSLQKAGYSMQELSPVMTVYGAAAVRDAVKNGALCGFVPLSVSVGPDSLTRYQIVKVEGLESERSLYLCRRRKMHLTPEMAIFRRFILGNEWRSSLPF